MKAIETLLKYILQFIIGSDCTRKHDVKRDRKHIGISRRNKNKNN